MARLAQSLGGGELGELGVRPGKLQRRHEQHRHDRPAGAHSRPTPTECPDPAVSSCTARSSTPGRPATPIRAARGPPAQPTRWAERTIRRPVSRGRRRPPPLGPSSASLPATPINSLQVGPRPAATATPATSRSAFPTRTPRGTRSRQPSRSTSRRRRRPAGRSAARTSRRLAPLRPARRHDRGPA